MKAKDTLKHIPGVERRDNSIRISFTTRDGIRHKKTYKIDGVVMAPSAANVKSAMGLVERIKAEIKLGVFEMSKHFPDDAGVLAIELVQKAKHRTVSAQLDLWRSRLTVAPSTANGYDSAVRFWKKAPAEAPLNGQDWQEMPLIGDLPIDALVLSHIKAAMASKAHLSGKTSNNYMSVLKQALDLAVGDKLIPDHPVLGKPVRRKWQIKPPDPFSKAQVSLIVADMWSHYPSQVAAKCEFWFLTGLRTSELHGLRWRSIDFRQGTIYVHEVLVRGIAKGETKTNKSRTVKLPQRALELLRMQKAHTFHNGEHVWDDPLNNGGPWLDERPFRRSYWTPTLKRLGIRYRRPYQCRHTNATMRLMAGQILGYAAQQMGHTVDMFVHIYTDWINDGHSTLEDQKLEQFLALETPKIADLEASGEDE